MPASRHLGNKATVWYDGSRVVLDLNSDASLNPSSESITFRSTPKSLIKALKIANRVSLKPLDYLEFEEEGVRGRVGYMASVDKFAKYLIYVELTGKTTTLVRVSRKQLLEVLGVLLMLPEGDVI